MKHFLITHFAVIIFFSFAGLTTEIAYNRNNNTEYDY